MTVVRRTFKLGLAMLPATILFAVLAIFGCRCLNARGPHWSASFAGFPSEIHQLPDGGYVLVRCHGVLGRCDSVGLLCTDSKLKQRWSVDYFTSSNPGRIRSVLSTTDGGFLLTCRDATSGRTQLVLVDWRGSVAWRLDITSLYNNLSSTSGKYLSGVGCSCPTADGGYVTTGGQEGLVALVKVNSAGKQEWQATGDSGPGNWVVQSFDHGYLVACEHPARLCKFESTGHAVWVRDLRAVASSFKYAYLAPNGECVMVTSYEPEIAKLDTAGNLQWQSTLGCDAVASVQPTSDGGFILAGSTHDADVALVKTDSLGREEWIRQFGGHEEEYGVWAEQTADGGYILAGYSVWRSFVNGDPMGHDIKLRKTDANGN